MEKGALRRINVEIRENRCLELRKAGWDYDDIAREVGFSAGTTAITAVKRALARTRRELSDDLLTLELARLDDAQKIAWDIATSDRSGPMQKLNALDRVLRIQERRAKYMGIDAPTKKEVTHKTELDVKIAELLKDLGAQGSPGGEILDGEVIDTSAPQLELDYPTTPDGPDPDDDYEATVLAEQPDSDGPLGEVVDRSDPEYWASKPLF